MRIASKIATLLGVSTLLFSTPASAADTFGSKDTISVLGMSTTGNNFYFWTTSTAHTCGGSSSTKWFIDVADVGDESMEKLAEMAFLSGLNVGMTYTCNGSLAQVSYIKVYR